MSKADASVVAVALLVAPTTMVTIGEVVAEAAAVAVDAGVLHDPAVGDNKSIGKIDIRPVLAFAHRGRSDLLKEVRPRDQTAGSKDRAPFAQVVNVGSGQPWRRAPERVPVS